MMEVGPVLVVLQFQWRRRNLSNWAAASVISGLKKLYKWMVKMIIHQQELKDDGGGTSSSWALVLVDKNEFLQLGSWYWHLWTQKAIQMDVAVIPIMEKDKASPGERSNEMFNCLLIIVIVCLVACPTAFAGLLVRYAERLFDLLYRL